MVGRAFREVFADGRYVLLAAATALVVFVVATWLPNLALVWQIAASAAIPLADKLKILSALVGSIATNFSALSGLSTIAIATLFGINLAMLAYYFRTQRRMAREMDQAGVAASLGGLLSGLFGVGCAACGTLVLSPLLTFIGAGGLVALLPFDGEEFDILGVGMLGLSFVLTARKISDPTVCVIRGANESELRQSGL